jgi:D-alanine--D-alanine ligase
MADHPATPPAEPASPDGRIHLVVLFGGQSAEHDVSCTTATHVLRAVDPSRYRVTPVGISRDGQWAIAAQPRAALAAAATDGSDLGSLLPDRLDPAGDLVRPTDLLAGAPTEPTVVVPLLHGPMGEDGTVQGLLELADVAYVGSGVLSSALAMDKAMAKQVLAFNGVDQARSMSLREHDIGPTTAQRLVDELGLPLFVKPANMGSSVGVSKAKTVDAVTDALHTALSYDEWVVVEEAITGREIEVAVLGNLEPRASVPGEIVPGAEFYDYADKYLDDGSRTLIPAPLTAEESDTVRELAVRIYRALRCEGMARVDFFYDDRPGGRGWLCNEVNTIPGFTPISMYPKLWMASGLSYAELVDELVRLALERQTRRRRNTERGV